MPEDAGSDMKEWLRADLRAAIKNRRTIEAKVLRALVAALDNAEAPPAEAGRTATGHHRFHTGSAEVERLLLSSADVRDVLLAEIDERERAAEEMDRLDRTDRAEALRAEALLARRYVR
jgi:uncharacterized protein